VIFTAEIFGACHRPNAFSGSAGIGFVIGTTEDLAGGGPLGHIGIFTPSLFIHIRIPFRRWRTCSQLRRHPRLARRPGITATTLRTIIRLWPCAMCHGARCQSFVQRLFRGQAERSADEEALVMLSDILPTGFECGVLNGRVQPGNAVAIVGAGPIGLAALLTAQFYAPAAIIMVDPDENRLEVAKRFGATATVNASGDKAAEEVMKLTDGRGVDTAIEAVGIPASVITCEDIVAPGGTIANIGVHGVKVDLHLERLWDRNITITTRLVDTVMTSMLLKTVQAGRLDPGLLVTHRFKLDEILAAYDTFSRAANTHALKVVIEA
jgi:hypothetical protein